MNIFLATDHAGFELKNIVKEHLIQNTEHTIVDCGARHFDADDDYPDFIAEAAKRVSAEPHTTRAIIFGGSGQGEAMLANRFKNVRAVAYYHHDLKIIELSRQHNDANILSIGARFVSAENALEAITQWLSTTPAADQKYQRRVKKAERLSSGQ